MLRRPHYIALGVVVLVTVAVLKLPNRTAAKLKLAISALYVPLFGAAGSTQRAIEKAGDTILPRKQLLEHIDELRKENQQLRLRSMQLETLAQENARLRGHLQLPKEAPWKVKLARVVAREPANWWRTIRIDLGARHGVATNAPVLTIDGLVGR